LWGASTAGLDASVRSEEEEARSGQATTGEETEGTQRQLLDTSPSRAATGEDGMRRELLDARQRLRFFEVEVDMLRDENRRLRELVSRGDSIDGERRSSSASPVSNEECLN